MITNIIIFLNYYPNYGEFKIKLYNLEKIGDKMIPFSDDELLEPVKSSLKVVMPMLQRDNGGLELLGIKNGVVYVRLVGACNGCAASGQTLKYGIERQLKLDIHPEISVVNIPVGEKFEL